MSQSLLWEHVLHIPRPQFSAGERLPSRPRPSDLYNPVLQLPCPLPATIQDPPMGGHLGATIPVLQVYLSTHADHAIYNGLNHSMPLLCVFCKAGCCCPLPHDSCHSQGSFLELAGKGCLHCLLSTFVHHGLAEWERSSSQWTTEDVRREFGEVVFAEYLLPRGLLAC